MSAVPSGATTSEIPACASAIDVEIALDHDDAAALPDGVARQAETVQRAPLVEDRRLGGVEVLGRWVAGAHGARQDAPAECDHPTAPVGDREHDAIAEAIVSRAGSPSHDESDGDSVVHGAAPGSAGGAPARPHPRAHSPGRSARSSRADAALGQVAAGLGTGRAAQRAPVERRRHLVHRHQRLAARPRRRPSPRAERRRSAARPCAPPPERPRPASS